MKQISDSEISSAISVLDNIYSFLNTSVAGRFGELQAFLGTNILGALIPAGTVDADEEGLQLIQLRKTDVQNLISILNNLANVSTSSTSDTCADLINAINNLSNQTTTIRNIVRTELSLNNTNIITPINTNIDSSRETLILQIYQYSSTIVNALNDISGTLAVLVDDVSTINARTVQIYDKTIEILTRIHETRQELKQTADRVIQIWNCIHTPTSTVENPVCRPTGTGGSTVDFTEILDDLAAILACCSLVDTYLRDFDTRVIAEFNSTKNLINTSKTDLITQIDENQTLITLANTRILNVQVTANEINNKIDNIDTGGGGSLPNDISETIYNTYNEINNVKNTVNNTYNNTENIRNSTTNTYNTVNNLYETANNTYNEVNDLSTTVNNTYNELQNIYNTVNNLYQTVNNVTNNNNTINNPPQECTVEMGVGLAYPCNQNNVDLTPILTAIKNLRDELIKSVNKEIQINDCNGVLLESYIATGNSFTGIFNYFDGIVKKIDNLQTIVCEEKTQKCVPMLIEPSELPIGFTKETQMFITWQSQSGSRWHSTLWGINNDILNKLKANTWQQSDWENYFSIVINRGHKATKQFCYLDIKYTEDKYKKIVFYLASISECSRLFNWINTKWVLGGIDYKSSSINNIQSFPVYAQSYIYSVAIQEYVNGEKTTESYCIVNPNI